MVRVGAGVAWMWGGGPCGRPLPGRVVHPRKNPTTVRTTRVAPTCHTGSAQHIGATLVVAQEPRRSLWLNLVLPSKRSNQGATHTCTVLSSPAEAIYFPSGDQD